MRPLATPGPARGCTQHPPLPRARPAVYTLARRPADIFVTAHPGLTARHAWACVASPTYSILSTTLVFGTRATVNYKLRVYRLISRHRIVSDVSRVKYVRRVENHHARAGKSRRTRWSMSTGAAALVIGNASAGCLSRANFWSTSLFMILSAPIILLLACPSRTRTSVGSAVIFVPCSISHARSLGFSSRRALRTVTPRLALCSRCNEGSQRRHGPQ